MEVLPTEVLPTEVLCRILSYTPGKSRVLNKTWSLEFKKNRYWRPILSSGEFVVQCTKRFGNGRCQYKLWTVKNVEALLKHCTESTAMAREDVDVGPNAFIPYNLEGYQNPSYKRLFCVAQIDDQMVRMRLGTKTKSFHAEPRMFRFIAWKSVHEQRMVEADKIRNQWCILVLRSKYPRPQSIVWSGKEPPTPAQVSERYQVSESDVLCVQELPLAFYNAHTHPKLNEILAVRHLEHCWKQGHRENYHTCGVPVLWDGAGNDK